MPAGSARYAASIAAEGGDGPVTIARVGDYLHSLGEFQENSRKFDKKINK